MSEDYQYALILDFDNVEGLVAYLQNPAHAGIGGLFTSAASASLAYDYELVELGRRAAACESGALHAAFRLKPEATSLKPAADNLRSCVASGFSRKAVAVAEEELLRRSRAAAGSIRRR